MSVMPAPAAHCAWIADGWAELVETSPTMTTFFKSNAQMNKFEFAPHGDAIAHTITFGPVGSGKCTAGVVLEILTPVRTNDQTSGGQAAEGPADGNGCSPQSGPRT